MFLRRLIRNKTLWAILIVSITLITALRLTAQDSQLFNKISSPVIMAFSPIQKVFSTSSFVIKDGFKSIPELFTLKRENEELKREIMQLENFKNRCIEYEKENENLRAYLELKKRSFQFDLEAAEVIGRDPGNWFNVVLINKGKNDGIEKDMAVITNKGLAGHIADVGDSYSKVLLITDGRSSVSAMIQRTRDNGILKGTIAPAKQGHLKMVYLPQDTNIVKGDIVISSGLGGVVPKGIVIGEVVEAKKEPYELMQYAIVKPIVDFHKLEQVFVIKDIEIN